MPLPFKLGAFYFAHFAWAGIFVAYFPLYLASRGLGPVEIAWVLALPQLARTFAPAGWGWFADRSGAQRGVVAFSCAANAVCMAFLPFVEGVGAIAALVAAMSLLSAAALPLVETITLSSLAGQQGRYGPIRMWGSIGFIATVLGGGAWLDARPIGTLPFALVAFAAASLAAAVFLPSGGVQSRRRSSGFSLTPEARALLGAGFFMAVAHGTLYAFLTLHLERLGYSGKVIGALWSAGVVAEILVFLGLPALFKRFSLAAILAASLALAMLRFLAIGWLAGHFWILALAQLLHAATFGAFHAASVAAVHRLFPEGAQARGQTLFSSIGYGAGGAVGALGAGWAWEAAGPGAAFTLSAGAAAGGLLLAYRLKRAAL